MSGTNTAEERARELHDKFTRGIALSTPERAELETWYAEQDRAESALLGSSVPGSSRPALQAQVDEAVSHLRTAAERVQELAAQNEALRTEVSALQRQLAQQSVAHAS